jgi:bifunctional DNase/RNase
MADEGPIVEVELAKIVIRERSPEQYIYLKEKDGERIFPIVIGIFEAIAINRHIRGDEPERPMTHDLMSNLLKGFDATLERVVVTDLKNETFHACLYIGANGTTVEVDSRPSDAIALAVRQNAKIFVAESVFDRVAGAQAPDGGLPDEP